MRKLWIYTYTWIKKTQEDRQILDSYYQKYYLDSFTKKNFKIKEVIEFILLDRRKIFEHGR